MEGFGVDVMIGAGQLYRRGEKPHWPRPARSAPAVAARSARRADALDLVHAEQPVGPPRGIALSGGCDERVFVQDYSLGLASRPAMPLCVSDALIIAAPDPVEIAADRLSANKAQISARPEPGTPSVYRGLPICRHISGAALGGGSPDAVGNGLGASRPTLWSHELALCLGAHFPRVAHGKCLEFLQTFAATAGTAIGDR